MFIVLRWDSCEEGSAVVPLCSESIGCVGSAVEGISSRLSYYALLFCDGDEMALLALREEFVSTLVTDVVDGPDILRALLEYVDRVRKFFNGFEIYRPSMDNIDFDGENYGDGSETHDDETDAMKWCDYMQR